MASQLRELKGVTLNTNTKNKTANHDTVSYIEGVPSYAWGNQHLLLKPPDTVLVKYSSEILPYELPYYVWWNIPV